MSAWLKRLVCRIDGHSWRFSQTVDFDRNRLYLCTRCGEGQWRSPFKGWDSGTPNFYSVEEASDGRR